MSTPIYFDFASGLRPGAAAPRVALADVLKLNEAGEEEPVVQGVPVDLRPRKDRQPVSVSVPAGTFLVRLRTPEGRLLMRRIEAGESRQLVFVPKVRERETQGELSQRRVFRQDTEDFIVSSPRDVEVTPAIPRAWWSAISMDTPSQDVTLSNLPGFQARGLVNEKYDNLGVVKILARSAETVPLYERISEDLTAKLVGEISAVQGAQLRGAKEQPVATWRVPLRKRALVGSGPEGTGNRYFAMGYRADEEFNPGQLACVPGTWRTQSNEVANLSVSFYERRIGNSLTRSLKVEVDDPDLGGLLDFLQRGELSGSVQMLTRATELLYQKYYNPYASAAAGYVLVQVGHWQGEHPNWRQWLLNLAQRYTSLPDGAILFTTLMLQGDSGHLNTLQYEGKRGSRFLEAEDAALEAIRRGPPLFRRGLKMMATNLAILVNRRASAGANDRRLRELVAASNYVREMSLRVDPNQPFCVFDVRDD